ncbi:hypothetical protein ACFFIX_20120 [Metabacillus herbersteinensis]|uniref:MFS transporter n=1 Tax=Metabacillus herbersteinensis TaxID=283816 RepID=A0ABV6GJK8_9BACI
MGKKSFRLLWIGQTMANAGDILYIVPVPFFNLSETIWWKYFIFIEFY